MGTGQAGVALRGQFGGSGTGQDTGGYLEFVVWVAGTAVLVLWTNTGLAAVVACQAGSLAGVHPRLALPTLWRQA